jgi:two-component system cell cycle response regulator
MHQAPRDLAVMVVDDDPAICRLIRKILEDDGFKVCLCATGTEALKRLFEEPWDILLLDLHLGDIEGQTLCEAVKKDPRLAGRHVIIVSADADPLQKVALLNTGADDYVTKPFHPAELVARVRAGARLVGLQQRLLVLNDTLSHSSRLDGLTALYNHKYFQEKLALEFEASQRYGRPLSVAMIDVDSFKQVNDTYGHAVGDRVLELLAKALVAETRSTDIAARYGGDEFALILRETKLDAALHCSSRIVDATRLMRIETDDAAVRVTVSIGLAAIPHRRVVSAKHLLEYADRALYRAKRSGRNQVQAWGRPSTVRSVDQQSAGGVTLSVV